MTTKSMGTTGTGSTRSMGTGSTGTITVKLLNAANSEIAVYTYDYEFIRNNPRYLTVGSERFPAMLENASGTGSLPPPSRSALRWM